MHLKTGEKTKNNELLLQLCEKLKDSIRSEIEKSKAEGADHDIDQLRHILNELEIMATTENALITLPSDYKRQW